MLRSLPMASLLVVLLMTPPSFADPGTAEPDHAVLTQLDGDRWSVSVERSLGDLSAAAAATFEGGAPDGAAPPHANAAGARAWLVLGRQLLEAGDPDAAADCASKGVEELGGVYADMTTVDDTGMKIAAARTLIRDGRVADGAGTLLNMLDARLEMYQQFFDVQIDDK
jgi:hypothetical protein